MSDFRQSPLSDKPQQAARPKTCGLFLRSVKQTEYPLHTGQNGLHDSDSASSPKIKGRKTLLLPISAFYIT